MLEEIRVDLNRHYRSWRCRHSSQVPVTYHESVFFQSFHRLGVFVRLGTGQRVMELRILDSEECKDRIWIVRKNKGALDGWGENEGVNQPEVSGKVEELSQWEYLTKKIGKKENSI